MNDVEKIKNRDTPEDIAQLFTRLETAENLAKELRDEERLANRNRISAEEDVKKLKEQISKGVKRWGVES